MPFNTRGNDIGHPTDAPNTDKSDVKLDDSWAQMRAKNYEQVNEAAANVSTPATPLLVGGALSGCDDYVREYGNAGTQKDEQA